MPTSYPGALDSLPRPGPLTEMDDAGFEGDIVIDNISDAIEAIQAKLGIGSSSPVAGGGVLRQSGAGASAWGQAQAGDLNAGGTANRVLRTTDGATAAWGQIVAAMLATSAVGRAGFTTDAASLSSNATGFQSSGGINVVMNNLIVGRTKLLVAFFHGLAHDLAGTTMQMGIGVDSTSSATYSNYLVAQTANQSQFSLTAGIHTATATSHTYQGLWNNTNGAGSIRRYGLATILAIGINE